METNEIQELFDKHTVELTYTDNTMRVMNEDDFAKTINQVELELKLEWFKELHTKLNAIFSQPTAKGVELELSKYIIEIQNKIKELEKELNWVFDSPDDEIKDKRELVFAEMIQDKIIASSGDAKNSRLNISPLFSNCLTLK